jgi:hypothetical protein
MNDDILLDEIVEKSYELLTKKLANGGVIANNEASFQLEFGLILHTIGQLYEFKPTDKFHIELESYITLKTHSSKSTSSVARVDIYMKYNAATAVIELKFFKKRNQREPNNRYDAYADISNLEKYKNEGINLCYFVLATDHSHYVNKEKYSTDTRDFDLRDNKKYTKGTVLKYNTTKPYGNPITLTSDYTFKWDAINSLYFLKLKIK